MADAVALQHRLALRLARYTVVLAFLIGLILSSLQVFGDYQSQESSIDQTIQQILVVSKPPATRAVNTLDTSLAEEVVNGLLRYHFITNARITDELGKPLAHSESEPGVSTTRWVTDKISTGHKTYTMALHTPEYAGIGPGHMVLDVDMDAALKPFYERSLFVIASGVARNVLLALLLMVIFYITLTRPLERLSYQFLKVRDKPQDKHVLSVSDKNEHNELGLLCDAGNQFIYTVQRLLAEKDQSSEALRLSEQRLLNLIDHVPQLVVAHDAEGDILFANQQYAEFYGQSVKDIHHFKLIDSQIAGVKEAMELDAIRNKTLRRQTVTSINEIGLTNYQGRKSTFSLQVAPFEYADKPGTLTVANDISGQIKAQAHIAHLASHDSLTGLPNRVLLYDRLKQAVRSSDRHDTVNAVLFLDLDHFKNINDAQGHSVGDEVLKAVAKLLTQTIRKTDTVARLGGDEFVVLLQELPEDRKQAAVHVKKVCDKIITELSRPVMVDERALPVGVSIGVVLFPIEGASREDLLRYADTAMYQAKAEGRNRAVFYHEEMTAMVEKRQALESELTHALQRKEFEMYYQPQLDKLGQPVGFEALVRWHHPKKGLVGPEEFIPVLESGGLILPISQWILDTCCAQIKQWQDKGFWQPHWHLCINISPLQFYQDDFIKQLSSAVEAAQISPEPLCLEITETIAVENIDFATRRLSEIRAMGIEVALDDFGTGFSSMSYLKDLPIDVLKIDRNFIQSLNGGGKDEAVMQAIVNIAQSLELTVVAEGIETDEQLAMASQMGCRCFQGFLFNRPLPAEDVVSHYRRH